jgi:hypothetical protein
LSKAYYCKVHGFMNVTSAGARCFSCDPFTPDLEHIDESIGPVYTPGPGTTIVFVDPTHPATAPKTEERGVKHDDGKPAFDLFPPMIELEVAKVLEFGARKYRPDNWKKVPGAKRKYFAAFRRHMNAHTRGEKIDPESGLTHISHAICSLMFLGEFDLAEIPEVPE